MLTHPASISTTADSDEESAAGTKMVRVVPCVPLIFTKQLVVCPKPAKTTNFKIEMNDTYCYIQSRLDRNTGHRLEWKVQ